MVFAIILDTFAGLRKKDEDLRADMRNHCYVCGIHRSEFERRALNFVDHNSQEHNVRQLDVCICPRAVQLRHAVVVLLSPSVCECTVCRSCGATWSS